MFTIAEPGSKIIVGLVMSSVPANAEVVANEKAASMIAFASESRRGRRLRMKLIDIPPSIGIVVLSSMHRYSSEYAGERSRAATVVEPRACQPNVVTTAAQLIGVWCWFAMSAARLSGYAAVRLPPLQTASNPAAVACCVAAACAGKSRLVQVRFILVVRLRDFRRRSQSGGRRESQSSLRPWTNLCQVQSY